jgi:hypothetical protein
MPAPDIRGRIARLDERAAATTTSTNRLATLLIEGAPGQGATDRASVAVTAATRIIDARSGERHLTRVDALAVGQRVEARFAGPVAQSYPVQAVAEEIVILADRT